MLAFSPLVLATVPPSGEPAFGPAFGAVLEAETGAEALRSVLNSDMLLMGCIAFALLALVSVSRVTARRRKSRNVRREMHAHTQAVHEFLSNVRKGSGASQQGVWHYDFSTGDQQFTDELKTLVAPDASVEDALKSAGVDLARLARQHSDLTRPYEAEFHLAAPGVLARPFMVQACNMRNGEGEVQRAVAIVREITPGRKETPPSD